MCLRQMLSRCLPACATNRFGKASAPMKAYFDYWEDFWTRRVPESDYFRRCRNEQYLMGNPGWLERPEPGEVARADAWIADPARPGMPTPCLEPAPNRSCRRCDRSAQGILAVADRPQSMMLSADWRN